MALRQRIAGVAVAVSAMMVAAALADPASPPQAADDARFSLFTTPDGFVRLDRQTGQTSLCQRQNEEWICRVGADDRLAYDSEIARLRKEKAALAAEIERLRAAAATPAPEPQAQPQPPANVSPSVTPPAETRAENMLPPAARAWLNAARDRLIAGWERSLENIRRLMARLLPPR